MNFCPFVTKKGICNLLNGNYNKKFQVTPFLNMLHIIDDEFCEKIAESRYIKNSTLIDFSRV